MDLEDVERTMVTEHRPNRRHIGKEDPSPFRDLRTKATPLDGPAGEFHERTKNRPGVEGSSDEFRTTPMLYAQANARSDYPGREALPLPEPRDATAALDRVLRDRRSRRTFAGGDVSLREIAGLLSPAGGVTARVDREVDGVPYEHRYRAYPSAGALYPVETYVCVLRGDDVETGLYYYAPERHALRVLGRDEDLPSRLERCFAVESVDVTDASLVVVLTASFWRTTAKYGPRGYRNALLESGHLAQNVQLTATELGLGSVPITAFYDDRLADLLGLDGVDEEVVYAVLVGRREDDE